MIVTVCKLHFQEMKFSRLVGHSERFWYISTDDLAEHLHKVMGQLFVNCMEHEKRWTVWQGGIKWRSERKEVKGRKWRQFIAWRWAKYYPSHKSSIPAHSRSHKILQRPRKASLLLVYGYGNVKRMKSAQVQPWSTIVTRCKSHRTDYLLHTRNFSMAQIEHRT